MLIMKNKLLKTAGILLMTAMTLTQAEASSTKAAAVTETAAGKAEVSGDKQINAMSLAEKNCMAILGLRLGDFYKKKTTDRREAKSDSGNDLFTIVGNAESAEDNLSFICKLEYSGGRFNITEFKLMRVVPQENVDPDEVNTQTMDADITGNLPVPKLN